MPMQSKPIEVRELRSILDADDETLLTTEYGARHRVIDAMMVSGARDQRARLLREKARLEKVIKEIDSLSHQIARATGSS